MSFEIKELQIKFYTNLENKELKFIDFNLNMLYNETVVDGKKSELNKTGLKNLPYFTTSKRYPLEKLLKELNSYQERVRFFFNEESFKKLNLYEPNNIPLDDTDILNETAKHNVMVMIKLLFPTKFMVINNFHNSYDHVLDNASAEPFYINPFKSTNFSYLKLSDGKIYTFTRLTWLNDILNHPLYRNFLNEFNVFISWYYREKQNIKKQIKANIEAISNNINIILELLFRGIKTSFNFYNNNKSFDEIILVINYRVLKFMSKLIQIKNIIEKMKIIPSVPFNTILKKANFDTTDKNEKYFLNTIVDKIKIELEELEKKSIAEEDVDKMVDNENSNNDKEISMYEKLKNYINKYFIQQSSENRIKNFLQSEDIEITKKRLKKPTKKINKIDLDLNKSYDSNESDSSFNPDDDNSSETSELSDNSETDEMEEEESEQLNIAEIKLALDKLKNKNIINNNEINLISPLVKAIIDKIDKSINTIKINKTDDLIKRFYDHNKYINFPLKKLENSMNLNIEYTKFMRILRSKYIEPFRTSINIYLQQLIIANDEKSVQDFFNIFEKINKMYMLGQKIKIEMEDEKLLNNIMNTSVNRINTNNDNWQYEIYIMADFIQGKIDDENINQIFCPYVGEYLGTMFELLFELKLHGRTDEKDTFNWAVDRNRVSFSIENLISKNGEVKKELVQKNIKNTIGNLFQNKGKTNTENKIDTNDLGSFFANNIVATNKELSKIIRNLQKYSIDINDQNLLEYINKNNKKIYDKIIDSYKNATIQNKKLYQEINNLISENEANIKNNEYILKNQIDELKRNRTNTNIENSKLYINILKKLLKIEENKFRKYTTTGGTKRRIFRTRYQTRKKR